MKTSRTLTEVADKNPLVKKILSDITIGHTDAAAQINFYYKNLSIYSPDLYFRTTESSVRRWRRATIDELDSAQSAAEPSESPEGILTKGSPLNPLEALSEPPDMKILFIDIETTPILAYVWRTWKENVNHDMIVKPSEILCFAASWLGSDEVIFYRKELWQLWNLLDKADVVIHYNGKSFDIPKINTEFITNGGISPPSPYRQVDLLLTARNMFKFESNKLAYVSKRLNTSGKIQSGGFSLWKGCMEDDPLSWADMEKYNKQDVVTLKEVYETMLPWITGHPSFAAFSGKLVCPTCGASNLKRSNYYYTSVSKYPRYVCSMCGTYSRSSHRIAGAEITGVAL